MITLRLTIKKRWFDMIASGEKKEEYLELKKYWADRLCNYPKRYRAGCRYFDAVEFKNGYGKNAPLRVMECKGIYVGQGNPDWGANPSQEYFVIKLGKRIK